MRFTAKWRIASMEISDKADTPDPLMGRSGVSLQWHNKKARFWRAFLRMVGEAGLEPARPQ